MRIFSSFELNHFVLALGHLGDQVRRYFLEYDAMTRDVTLRLAHPENRDGKAPLIFGHQADHEAWHVTLVDTGLLTEKAGRLSRVRPYLAHCDRFIVAYGEAVADIDIENLLNFHTAHGKKATVTGIQVNFQYGMIEDNDAGVVTGFQEKPKLPYWINGGFMVFERDVLDLIPPDRAEAHLENDILPQLAEAQELMLYRHTGYWQSMKTLKDARTLQRDWETSAPWKRWDSPN